MKENLVSRVLITKEEIDAIIKDLGQQITATYTELERPLMVVGLLKGSFIFMADLIREINVPLVVDFMSISSYGDDTESSGDVKILMDLNSSVDGRDILLVEDIIDSGRTFSKVIRMLKNRNPRSIKICAFLNKPSARIIDVPIDFCGKDVANEFVVGYGLDHAQNLRDLPFVGVLEGGSD